MSSHARQMYGQKFLSRRFRRSMNGCFVPGSSGLVLFDETFDDGSGNLAGNAVEGSTLITPGNWVSKSGTHQFVSGGIYLASNNYHLGSGMDLASEFDPVDQSWEGELTVVRASGDANLRDYSLGIVGEAMGQYLLGGMSTQDGKAWIRVRTDTDGSVSKASSVASPQDITAAAGCRMLLSYDHSTGTLTVQDPDEPTNTISHTLTANELTDLRTEPHSVGPATFRGSWNTGTYWKHARISAA